MMKRIVFGLALAGIGYTGMTFTGGSNASTETGISSDDNIALYRKDDAGINAAKAKGRETLPRFFELMAAKTPGNYTFKTGLLYDDDNREHVWVQFSGLDGDNLQGLVANQPVYAKQYKLGSPITVARKDVSDWMIMSETAIYGGYTMRHSLSQLPKEQAEKFEALLRD